MNPLLAAVTVLLIYGLVRLVSRLDALKELLLPLSLAPALVLELALFYALLYGWLGLDYGVAAQFFRHEPGQQLAAGVAVGLFLGLLSAFLTLLAGRHSPFGQELASASAGRAGVGLFLRFSRRNSWYLGPLLVLALIPAIPGVLPDHPSLVGAPRRPWLLGLWLGALAYAAGMFLVCAAIARSRRSRPSPEGRAVPIAIAHQEGDLLVFSVAVALGVAYLLAAAIHEQVPPLPPAVAGCLLLATLAAVYTLIVYRHPMNQLPVFVIVFVLVSFTNGVSWDTRLPEFKYRFPGLDPYYDEEPGDLPTRYHVLDSVVYQKQHVDAGEEVVERVGLLDNEAVLDRWLRGHGHEPLEDGVAPGRGLPKLAIVTVSGGGIRAATWTAEVLTELERRLGREGVAFPRHARLVTGASGGMMGAAAYVVGLDPDEESLPWSASRPDTVLDQIVDGVAADGLGAVFRALVFDDLPSALVPRSVPTDRGLALERAWEGRFPGLRRPVRAFKEAEAGGRLPSLVFTPMFVEDGRRLLISNLDLSLVTRNHTQRLHPRIPAKPKDEAVVPAVATLSEDGLTSFTGVEFFRLFPDADAFRVSTAARMSATFPYVSPAVSLPTRPPRRVVDAGYYDNYGVNLASTWILEFRDWLMRNTSGVVLVEIRDHESQDSRLELGAGGPGPGGLGHSFRLGATALLSPMTGLLSARSASMTYRNDEQLEWLGVYLPKGIDDREGGERVLVGRPDYDGQQGRAGDFFVSVVFEAPEGVSLSWSLTPAERTILSAAIDSRDSRPIDGLPENVARARQVNQRRLETLVEWWSRPDAGPPGRPDPGGSTPAAAP